LVYNESNLIVVASSHYYSDWFQKQPHENIHPTQWWIDDFLPKPSKVYREYSLDELPVAAKPQPHRVHRGMHSYTVQTAVEDLETGKLGEVLVDVLLQKRAFFVKKCPPCGKRGQVSWKKSGGAKNAWVITLDQARCGSRKP